MSDRTQPYVRPAKADAGRARGADGTRLEPGVPISTPPPMYQYNHANGGSRPSEPYGEDQSDDSESEDDSYYNIPSNLQGRGKADTKSKSAAGSGWNPNSGSPNGPPPRFAAYDPRAHGAQPPKQPTSQGSGGQTGGNSSRGSGRR